MGRMGGLQLGVNKGLEWGHYLMVASLEVFHLFFLYNMYIVYDIDKTYLK